MKRAWLALGIVGLLSTAVPAADPNVTVTLLQIRETRVGKLVQDPKYMVANGGLTIDMKIGGPDEKSPTNMGRWKFSEILDDTGTSLMPKDTYFLQNLQQVGDYQINKEDGSFTTSINLGVPSRKATKIASLKGEFTLLAGGEKKDATIKAVKSLAGKEVDDATLKAAGLVVKVLEEPTPPAITIGGGTPTQSVRFDISGNFDAMQKLKLVDKDGKDLPGNPSWQTDEKTKVTHYTFYTPKVDADTGVVISVVVGLKSMTVPMVLKDVPLP